ncbi:MAG: stage III sporulation protein AB [Clostridia bacterium]|nr:stage III sporulation protein AB [Clostridia bacterium]
MLRPICAALAFLICAAAGMIRAERMKLRLSAAEGLLSDLGVIEASLRYERKPALLIAEELARSGKLSRFWNSILIVMNDGLSFGDAWRKVKGELGIGKTELAALDGFAENFGSTDAETELARLFAAKARLSDAVSALRAEYPKKRKLASSLGMLAGCAAALMLI